MTSWHARILVLQHTHKYCCPPGEHRLKQKDERQGGLLGIDTETREGNLYFPCIDFDRVQLASKFQIISREQRSAIYNPPLGAIAPVAGPAEVRQLIGEAMGQEERKAPGNLE
jgi:hypothetical protein